ncbi:MAG: InlB B-repeat-containing protein [Clostridia bacterium]|nr:InlB B-repeat-containing protein [Clostridia bacterium]
MKKKIKALLCIILGLICIMSISCDYFKGIDFPPEGLEWDGRFLYYPVGNSYAIVGSEQEFGKKSEVLDKLYLPSHYKGKPVIQYHYQFLSYGTMYTFGIDMTPVKEVYLHYNIGALDTGGGIEKFEKIYCPIVSIISHKFTESKTLSIYVPNVIFEDDRDCYKQIKGDFEISVIKESSWYMMYTVAIMKDTIRTLYKANTAYMFNYEGSPNQDYYFINDFEHGGLIENTPYEPIREGYEFCGWYKESECITKWDFTTDVLPAPTYDENGELEYVETKLYAKWNKI